MTYWRTKDLDEVDIVLNNEIGIEIKSTKSVQEKHLSGLKKIAEEGEFRLRILVSQDVLRRQVLGCDLWYWREFLVYLWSGSLV